MVVEPGAKLLLLPCPKAMLLLPLRESLIPMPMPMPMSMASLPGAVTVIAGLPAVAPVPVFPLLGDLAAPFLGLTLDARELCSAIVDRSVFMLSVGSVLIRCKCKSQEIPGSKPQHQDQLS